MGRGEAIEICVHNPHRLENVACHSFINQSALRRQWSTGRLRPEVSSHPELLSSCSERRDCVPAESGTLQPPGWSQPPQRENTLLVEQQLVVPGLLRVCKTLWVKYNINLISQWDTQRGDVRMDMDEHTHGGTRVPTGWERDVATTRYIMESAVKRHQAKSTIHESASGKQRATSTSRSVELKAF